MMNKYNQLFSKYPNDVRIYEYQEIPENRTFFLISSKEFDNKSEKWIDYIEGHTYTHPNNYFDYVHGSCKFTKQGVIDIFTEVSLKSRFHGVCKKLLQKDFVFCFQFHSAGEKPFIMVSQEWFDNIHMDNYSVYAMVDIIGIKNYLLKHGLIEDEVITKYKKAVDRISSKESNYTFITFTDNIFIKRNWNSSGQEYLDSYKPEHMLHVIKEIQTEIYNVFKLTSYAIVTQGLQLFKDNENLIKNNTNNHFFIGSVATPFIELFDIETAIKNKIVKNPEFKQSLYLSESFYISLRFNTPLFDKEKFGISEKLLDNNSGVSMDSFRAINLDELLDKIEKI